MSLRRGTDGILRRIINPDKIGSHKKKLFVFVEKVRC